MTGSPADKLIRPNGSCKYKMIVKAQLINHALELPSIISVLSQNRHQLLLPFVMRKEERPTQFPADVLVFESNHIFSPHLEHIPEMLPAGLRPLQLDATRPVTTKQNMSNLKNYFYLLSLNKGWHAFSSIRQTLSKSQLEKVDRFFISVVVFGLPPELLAIPEVSRSQKQLAIPPWFKLQNPPPYEPAATFIRPVE